jgi:hypothetical protein
MPLIWKNGEQVHGTWAEYVAQLHAVADRMNARFAGCSDERGLIGNFLHNAANNIKRLATNPDGK